MKKRVLVVVAVMLSMILLISSAGLVAFAADNQVQLALVFDRDAYVPGETAVASLQILGLKDEADEGMKLSAFETHIGFDPEQLTFLSESNFTGVSAEVDSGNGEVALIQVAESHPNMIVVLYEKSAGTDISVGDGDVFELAKIKFTVGAGKTGETALTFESGYPSVLLRSAQTLAERKLSFSAQTGDTAQVEQSVIETDTPTYDAAAQTVTGKVTARMAAGQKAVVIAALYSQDGRLYAQPVVRDFPVTEDAPVVFANVPQAAFDAGLKVKYMFWDGLATLKSLAAPQSKTVTAGE